MSADDLAPRQAVHDVGAGCIGFGQGIEQGRTVGIDEARKIEDGRRLVVDLGFWRPIKRDQRVNIFIANGLRIS